MEGVVVIGIIPSLDGCGSPYALVTDGSCQGEMLDSDPVLESLLGTQAK